MDWFWCITLSILMVGLYINGLMKRIAYGKPRKRKVNDKDLVSVIFPIVRE